jgi:uncharacterized protein (UPF0332 family)
MPTEYGSALALYRLERAAEDLETARIDFAAGMYNATANRVYYSVFHSMRSVLALGKIDFKRHSGLISYFLRNYIKVDIFEKRYSDLILEASTIRNSSDYDDYYVANKEDTQALMNTAAEFYQAVKDYVLAHTESA